MLYFKGPEKYLIPMIYDSLTQIIKNEFTKEQFDLFKKKLYKSFQNAKFANAAAQIDEKFNYFYYKNYAMNLFKKQKLKWISYEQFIEYKVEFIKNTFIEGFCSGNISEKECSEVFSKIENREH